jgi:hypothetical protein
MIPPTFIVVRVGWIWIPFPLFLLWPFLIIAWIILGMALTAAFIGVAWYSLAMTPSTKTASDKTPLYDVELKNFSKIWITTWQLICAFRGTSVDVDQVDTHVTVSII